MDGQSTSFGGFADYTDIIDASEYNDTENMCQRQSFTTVQMIFRVYLLPIVSLFGLIANVINIRVFSHEKMRNQPVNWFFLALSVSDLAVMLTSFLVFQLPAYAEKMDNLGFYNAAQQIILTFYPLARSSHTCSVVLTVVVSVHRYLGVCHPFLIRRISNAAVIRTIIVGSIVFSFLFNGTKWFDLQITSCNSTIFVGELEKVIEPTSNMLTSFFYYSPYIEMSGYTVVMFILPFTILIFVNVKIVLTLRNSHRLRRQMTQRNGGKKDNSPMKIDKFKKKRLFKRNLSVTCEKEDLTSNGNSTPPNGAPAAIPVASGCKKESSQTISVMLLAITCQFLSFNLLAFIHNMIELTTSSQADESMATQASFAETLLTELSTFLVNLNCASTIVIYLKFGSKYRVVFLQMLSICPCLSLGRPPSPHCTALKDDTTLLISQGSSIKNKLWPTARSQSVHRTPERTPNDLRIPNPRQNRAMSAQITLDHTINQFTSPIRV